SSAAGAAIGRASHRRARDARRRPVRKMNEAPSTPEAACGRHRRLARRPRKRRTGWRRRVMTQWKNIGTVIALSIAAALAGTGCLAQSADDDVQADTESAVAAEASES